MNEYNDKEIAELLRRSYMAVDGLWFVFAEQRDGYEGALALDEEVWRVMPKLQARKAREILGAQQEGLEALAACLGLKMAAEGHQYRVNLDGSTLEMTIEHCRWHDVFVKSERLHLAADIARNICVNEAAGWAREFGVEADFNFQDSVCADGQACRFCFRSAAEQG